MNPDNENQYFHYANTIQGRKRKQNEQSELSTTKATFTTQLLNTTHGSSYPMLLALQLSLSAYKMQLEDDNFNFTITLEDQEGGKFDDIVLRCPSQKLVIYMQCKHKMPKDVSTTESTNSTNYNSKKMKAEASIISSAFLCDNGPFSIPTYFTSYLETQSLLENDHYFLCTNAVIDEDIIEYFSEEKVDPGTNHVASCYKDLNGKFYQINQRNQWLTLYEKLKKASLICLGKSLAKCIYHQQNISRTSQLYTMYAVLVNNIIERSDRITALASLPDQQTLNYKFKDVFRLADKASDYGKLRETFSKEYEKLLGKGKDIWKDIDQKGINTDWNFSMSAMDDAFNLMNNENSEFVMVDAKIAEFYSKFRLICTPDEEILHHHGKILVSELTDAESETSFDYLRFSIHDLLKAYPSVIINSNYLNEAFDKLKRNFFFTQLKTSTKAFTMKLEQVYPHGLINRNWLENSNFFQFLCNKSANEFYHYRSSVNLDFSAMIILETLNLLNTECLFIHESNYHQSKALEEILSNIFKYNEAVLGSTLYIIVVLDLLEYATPQTFIHLSKSHQQRLILLTPLTDKEEPSETSLLVRDLAEDARSKLFSDNNQLHFYGTSTSIGSLVLQSDDVSFVFKVLNFHSESLVTDKTNINLYNYEKIRKSYIQREVETYSPSRTVDSYSNREIKKCFEYLKGSIVHQSYSFDEMIETFDNPVCKPVYDLVRSSLSKPEIENNISDLLENENRNKCKVLLDEAGSGKSVYFTWLAWRLSVLNSSLFVVRMNADKFSSEFDRLSKVEINSDDSELIRILYRFISLALVEQNVSKRFETVRFRTELNEEKREMGASLLHFANGLVTIDESKTKCLSFEQMLELRLFCSKFNAKQLVLLFDAYDEIFPDYSDIVIRCFAGFSRFDGIRNIYFSSRVHEIQDDFKKAIKDLKILQLKPFSHHHQILLLHKHFLNEVNEYEYLESNYQLVVLSVVYTILINGLDDLVRAPLLLHLAIDAFSPIVREHIQFSLNTIHSNVFQNKKFQTFDTVKFFVDKKLEILNKEKSGSTDIAASTVTAQRKNQLFIKNFERVHAIMAIYILFDKRYVNTIVSQHELQTIGEDIEQGEEKAGIIVGFKNNIPLFIHRTFAEYMAALWLFKNKSKLSTEPYFKSQMFWSRGFDRIRDFFNQMIVRENGTSEIHMAVLNKSMEEVKAMIEVDSSLVTVKDAGGRIPLLLALQHDNHEVLKFLLEKMSSIDSTDLIHLKDKLFHWNALDYAFVTSNKHAIKVLLDSGANIDIVTLRDQIFSNDNDSLLIQASHYINQLSSPTERKPLSRWTVKYLYKERKIDLNDKRERLDHLTMLEYCIAKNAYDLFEQLLLQLDNPSVFLSTMGNHLIKTALARNAYNVVCFLIDKFNLHPQQINNNLMLFAAVKAAIELNRMKSLQIFLDLLCFRLNIGCASDASFVVNDSFENIQIVSLDQDQFPKSCCVRKSTNVLLPLPEYNERNVLDKNYLFETLLARAAHEGNVRILSYIIQKFQKPISNRTIVMVMRLLPKGKRLIHNQSVRAFKFLLDQTTDLESIDEHGRNLLHMTIQNGCFFMVQCLIQSNFNRTLINESNRWNIFHYIAASESKYNNRALKLYQLFTSFENTDHFDSVDMAGNSVYETAVLSYNFDIAREMIERTQLDPMPSKRVEFVLETVERLVAQLHEVEAVLEYFKYLVEFGDNTAWIGTFSLLLRSIPII